MILSNAVNQVATVYLALGSNMADPKKQIEAALFALRQLPESQLISCSSFYRTPPLGPEGQEDYLNAVVKITSRLTPLALLEQTQRIEQQQGRVRKNERWGPRTLDIDILLFDQLQLQSERLTLPHYAMYHRLFMLYPLYEIAPSLRLPNGILLGDYLQQHFPNQSLPYWQE